MVRKNNVFDMDGKRITLNSKELPPSGTGGDGGMEARIAKLEADVENIKTNVTDIKTDIRDLRNNLNTKFLWMLGTFITLYLTLLGVIAKGFKWL